MAISVKLNSRFKQLDRDRSFRKKTGQTPSREKEIMVDVTYDGSHTYSTGGDTVDLSVVGHLKQAHMAWFVNDLSGFVPVFVPDSNNAATAGKIKIYVADNDNTTGGDGPLVELANSATSLQGKTFTMVVRGI